MLLSTWNNDVFLAIKHRLVGSAMSLIHAERKGELIDSQLVIGVRDSCVHLRKGVEKSLAVGTALKLHFMAGFRPVSAAGD